MKSVDSDINTIVTTLLNSPSESLIHKRWTGVAGRLGVPYAEITNLQKRHDLGIMSMTDVLTAALTLWSSIQSTNATLEVLLDALKQNKLNAASDKIIKKFNENQSEHSSAARNSMRNANFTVAVLFFLIVVASVTSLIFISNITTSKNEYNASNLNQLTNDQNKE